MSLRLKILKKVCASNGHQTPMGRTAHVIDGQVVLLCNQCGEKVRS